MPTPRPILLVAMVVAAATLVASCGGDAEASDAADAAAARDTPVAQAGGLPDDVCALLSPTLAAEVLGSTEAPMTPGDPADVEATALASCAYGSITDVTGGLTIQVASLDAADPFALLIPEGTAQEPLALPPGAVRHAIGLVPGGSGIGSTVLFDHDGMRVAVSIAGVDVDEVDTDGLDRVAATVHAQLDRP